MTQFTSKSICLHWYNLWNTQCPPLNPYYTFYVTLCYWSWFACMFIDTTDPLALLWCWFMVCILTPLLKVSSSFSWKSMVLFIWTKFDTWLMNCLDKSFVTGSCNLVLVTSYILRRSSNEFNICPTPLDVCYRFYIFPCFATSLKFIFSSVLILFTCEFRAYFFGDPINKYRSQCINIASILILITLINLFL
jgi:hypothetical protein